MESASIITFLYFFLSGDLEKTSTMWVIASLWSIHYFNRSFIYPFRQKDHKEDAANHHAIGDHFQLYEWIFKRVLYW